MDPGTSNIGMAIVTRSGRRWKLLHSPVLHSLSDLGDALLAAGQQGYQIATIGVERVAWAHIGAAGKIGGHGSSEIARSVGMAELFAKIVDARFIEIAPISWRKRITGSGKSTKEDARRVLRLICDDIPKVFGTNRSDATALAISGAMEPP